MKIQPYLVFEGNCQEALNFYQKTFGGQIINRETYENKEIDIPEHYRGKLQHAELKGEGFHFMGYDASPDTPLTSGSTIQMSIDLNSREEVNKIFDKLSNSGIVHTPLQETSWKAYYGRCSDQFNINWMINCKL
ncbi:VOC family protein [Aquimarina algicola]|uniref:VOC family protein n=1 Tax=Aquimarina algicola TaxID=2589995 RepID=A0A504JDM0_9FLAO|nr:VOC family protein [Aquimarina algicola]TPN84481.1 VOC family protein [Aquimarina algicola]